MISAVSGWILLLSCFKELSELNANNVDPDQTPLLRRLIWVYLFANVPFMGR